MLGAVAAGFAICLTYIIAQKQGEESSRLSDVLDEVKQLVEETGTLIRRMAERDSAEDYDLGAVDEEPQDEHATPSYKAEAIEKLKAKGADLDFDKLEWKRKVSNSPLRGNHGWFVESPKSTARWFVRRARGMTVRKAMPRDYLEKLEQDTGLSPRSIALDFQLKQHGLAAWYARTYTGDLFKVVRSNRVPGKPIRTEKVVEEGE